MKNLILICIVVVIFILGYFIMKKVDMFLAGNNLQTMEHYPISSLRIAFETPDLVEQAADLLERFSRENPGCEIILFYGTAEKIEKGLIDKELDLGFIIDNCYDILDSGFNFLFISFRQDTVISNSAGFSVFPLDKSEKKLKIVWMEDDQNHKKKMFAELLRSFSKELTPYSAYTDV